MIDHIIITVSDFERSVAFYTAIFEPLGVTLAMDFKGEAGHPDLKGFGDSKSIFFWLKQGDPVSNGVHIGLIGKDHSQIHEFHETAVAAGAHIIDAPRIFSEYYPGYYATWITDPDGYEIELSHKS